MRLRLAIVMALLAVLGVHAGEKKKKAPQEWVPIIPKLPARLRKGSSPPKKPPSQLPSGPVPDCPAGMVGFPGFCMDRYEAPNEKGRPPFAYQTAADGEAWCEDRGKRLCSEAEWVRACRGKAGRTFPYGDTFEEGKCNIDKTYRLPDWPLLGRYPSERAIAHALGLYQADPGGSRQGCVSEEGVNDLIGNVTEWVVRSFDNRTNYKHVMKGGFWCGGFGVRHPSCGFVNSAHPGTFRSYEAGFRCCK